MHTKTIDDVLSQVQGREVSCPNCGNACVSFLAIDHRNSESIATQCCQEPVDAAKPVKAIYQDLGLSHPAFDESIQLFVSGLKRSYKPSKQREVIDESPYNAAKVIYTYWKAGRKDSIELVMSHLQTTNRGNITPIMAEARLKAGRMIRFAEIESQLDDLPGVIEAYHTISDAAQTVALTAMNDERSKLETDQAALRKERQNLQAAMAEVKQANAVLKSKVSDTDIRLNEAKQALQTAQKTHKDELDAIRDDRDHVRTELSAMSGKFESSEGEVQRLRDLNSEQEKTIDALESTNDDLVIKLQSSEQKGDHLQSLIDDLKAQMKEKELAHQTREANWLNEKNVLQKAQAKAESEISSLNATMSGKDTINGELTTEIQSLTEQLVELKTNLDAARGENIRLDAKLGSAVERAEDVEKSTRNRLIELERHNAAMSAELQRLGKKPGQLKLD